MAGWGCYNNDCSGQWTAEVDMSGLFTYPMAAFAKRVSANPDMFPVAYRDDAITFANAVVETYTAFRSDIQWTDPNNSNWSYYVDPTNGVAWPYNVVLSSLRPMAEVASAVDSDLYKTSPQYYFWTYYYATYEAPQLIAKTAQFFVDNLNSGDPSKSADGHTAWYWWNYAKYPGGGTQEPENMSHASLTIDSLLNIWDNRSTLDAMLARNGLSLRVSSVLTSAVFGQIANTFLERVWYNDTSNAAAQNLITNRIDGPLSGVPYPQEPIPSPYRDHSADGAAHGYPLLNGNALMPGFAELAEFNPWVWLRMRDSVFNTYLEWTPNCSPAPVTDGVNPCTWPALSFANHAALLRYRAFY